MLATRMIRSRNAARCVHQAVSSRRRLGAVSMLTDTLPVASIQNQHEDENPTQSPSLGSAARFSRWDGIQHLGFSLYPNDEAVSFGSGNSLLSSNSARPLRHERILSPAAPCKTHICKRPDSFALRTFLTRTALLGGSGNHYSSQFERTMHNVVYRAAFSTQPQERQEETIKSKPLPPPGSASTKKESTTDGSTAKDKEKTTASSISDVPSSSEDKRNMAEKTKDAIISATKAIVKFFLKVPGVMWYYLTHPLALRDRMLELKEAAKKEAQHYWMGTKLLYADLRTARKMLGRTLKGSPLTRRERKQLLRTVSDLFRLVPMSMFVLIPFMEFALPFALKLFPNMLPSTFQDSLKAEENMKRELQMRIAMAQFFQETLGDLAKEQKKQAEQRRKKATEDENETLASKQEETASSMIEFLDKSRKGEMLPPDVIIKFATHFHDDLTLDNMPRMQLINMCKYMSIPPYGADSFLRFQLRNRIRSLKEDDQRILWEGIDSLTKMELREACRERGMRSTGMSKDAYKKALQQWLDLSVNQKVPISLLIMSRTFFLREEMIGFRAVDDDGSKSVAGLADAISGLDKEVVNEVVLEVATAEEKQSDPEVMKLKLEVLEHQNELIREEQEEREAAAKKKEQMEKEKEIMDASEEAPKETEHETLDLTGGEKEIGAKEPRVSIADGGAETPKDDVQRESKEEEVEEDEEEPGLSSGELEAISQLVSPDPVRNEREELKRIRAAMSSDDEEPETETKVADSTTATDEADEDGRGADDELPERIHGDITDERVAETVAEVEARVDREASEVTVFSAEEEALDVLDGHTEPESEVEEYSSEDRRLDNAIKRLKSRVESMVGKIEVQLSDIEVKIGDKLHVLDKDGDGILTQEEMANALQQVLKRQLTKEEAMVIASDMDENEDGFLTVAELFRWLETNKIVKLFEEGRDADVDRIIAKQVESSKEEAGEESSDQIERQK